jgi:uncharacterized protein YifN (PemK superfamily)
MTLGWTTSLIDKIKADMAQKVTSNLVWPYRRYRAVAGLLHLGNHQDAVSMTKMAPNARVFIQQDIDKIRADMTQKVSSNLVRPYRRYRAGTGLLHVGNHQYAVSMTKIHKTAWEKLRPR